MEDTLFIIKSSESHVCVLLVEEMERVIGVSRMPLNRQAVLDILPRSPKILPNVYSILPL
jgi:hypothetical protein